jgi:hypothetical protein
MITDLLIAALPVRGIWRLQLVRRQKIALIVILTLGWLWVLFRTICSNFCLRSVSICIVSILRLHSLVVLNRNEQDSMFYGGPPIYWAAIEMNLAIVCACVPALKPLVIQIIPSFASGHSRNNSSRFKPSKWSNLARPFNRLNGDGSAAKSADVEQGSMGSEWRSITALPPVHCQPSKKGHIRVTHDVHQHTGFDMLGDRHQVKI